MSLWNSFYWGLMNFILYLTPLYIFMLDIVIVKMLGYEDIANKVFNRLIIIPLSLLMCSLFFISGIWGKYNILLTSFYITIFIIIFYKLAIPLGEWRALVIATLSVFMVSEIWELPIKIQILVSSNFLDMIKIISVSILKMVSILMMLYYMTKMKWHNNNFLISMSLFLIVFLVVQYFNTINFINGLALRVVTAVWVTTLALGFKR